MGYLTKIHGAITITPPLSWAEIKNSAEFMPRGRFPRERELAFHLVEYAEEVAEGTLTRVTAGRVVSAFAGEAITYQRILKDLQELVDCHPDHEFSGHLDCQGENLGDRSRILVLDRRAVEVSPQEIWPNELSIARRIILALVTNKELSDEEMLSEVSKISDEYAWYKAKALEDHNGSE